MTQAELTALPELGGIAYRENCDGTKIPSVRENVVLDTTALRDGEPLLVVDSHGIRWMLGYVHGRLCKRQNHP
jgi:hypothetical protein